MAFLIPLVFHVKQPPASPAASPGTQHAVGTGLLYGLTQQLSPSAPAYPGPFLSVSSSAGPSTSSQKEHMFPERPGQPECQFYVRTGDCKFGSACRYHHPPEWSMPKTTCALNSEGLPLRPVCISDYIFVFSFCLKIAEFSLVEVIHLGA